MKILFVCTGNVCRSPMAQVIFENMTKGQNWTVESCGTFTMDGLPMTDTARMALRKCGEKLGRKVRKSTRWRDEMKNEYDYIITMTRAHAEKIGFGDNVLTLDIADPFMQSLEVYVACCKKLQSELREIYRRIK